LLWESKCASSVIDPAADGIEKKKEQTSLGHNLVVILQFNTHTPPHDSASDDSNRELLPQVSLLIHNFHGARDAQTTGNNI